jgi:ABC-type antimicrobial peptide transport system permease subunit
MKARDLVFRSLVFYARAHAGVVLGAALASAILAGALVVGDSVRASLRRFAGDRLGRVAFAMAGNERFFRAALADELAARLNLPVVAALQMPATATTAEATARANHVQLLGIPPVFWKLAGHPASFADLDTNTVLLNERLASQLGLQPGGTLLLRTPKPSLLSREAPISPQEDASTALRLTVGAILRDDQFGRFSLQANQVAPGNAFVSLAHLQARLELPGRANLLLVGAEPGPAIATNRVTEALHQAWQLADAQLELRTLPATGETELRTGRVFLEAPVADAVLAMPQARGILTYFVNELRCGSQGTPYSIVSALPPGAYPGGLADHEILVNQWLAEDLSAKPGDSLTLAYFVVGSRRQLEERQHTFTIRGVIPMTDPLADRQLMPDYPGLAKADHCRDWDAGFPIKLDRIRAKDEKYWQDYRGTPKAFITLGAGQQLWSNRFGNLTAVRFPAGAEATNRIEARVREAIRPAGVGMVMQPVREMAAAAATQGQDFGQLFLGFSFFLVLAALILIGLLFQFGVEQRLAEAGTLLALGFTPGRVRRLFLLEAGVLVGLGSLLGVPAGCLYGRAMIYGLTHLWQSAVGTPALFYHAAYPTLLAGAAAGAAVAWASAWWTLRKQFQRPVQELIARGAELEPAGPPLRQKTSPEMLLATFALMGGSLVMGAGALSADYAAPVFFLAGALFLAGGLALAGLLLTAQATADGAARPGLAGIALRNAARRRQRSLATLGLLACGSFLIVAVSANRLDASRQADQRRSGTGGFALVAETSLPVVHDLNTPAGLEFYGLDASALAGGSAVQCRVREGDDASCLNLNRAQVPRFLGVPPEALQSRGAFSFATVARGLPADQPWRLLTRAGPGEPVPVIGDAASIKWAMGRSVGDLLTFLDERGRPFQARIVAALANSILQGCLVMAETDFIQLFPSETGCRFFLVDTPPAQAAPVSATLTRAFRDVGMEVTSASRRLDAFNAVQNTYLSTFQLLGGLGLVLGSVGVALVVLRNVHERRSELALMVAMGFRVRAISRLILWEHSYLLLGGLGVGTLSAAAAVLPALRSPGGGLPYVFLLILLAAVVIHGLLWTWVAVRVALHRPLLAALRNE